ncbi:MAG: hypothetical protein ABSB10_03525 [Candidatus Bathyarchaeia archaeon]|jgi:hypothetical protein
MPKQTNETKNPLKKWYLQKKSFYDNPIHKDYSRYLGNILSNSGYRIILSCVISIGIFAFFAVLLSEAKQTSNWVITAVSFAIFIILIYFPAKYVWANFNQLSYEVEINIAISSLKWRIKNLSKTVGKKNYRSFQAGINRLRINLINFLENSEIVSPPVSNFELNRVKKRIDIFSNCTSEVLVPINKLFSLEEEIEEQNNENYENFLLDDVDETGYVEEIRQKTGQFTDFDLKAMDDFLDHLWDVLFEKEIKPYSVISYKHPVNLILLSRFFDSWNAKIATCNNCKLIFERASKDIEEYYKSATELESESRQRRWRLRDDVIIVIVSVGLSTLIQYLISLPK